MLDAAAELGVAPETVRRDLRQMESAGRLQRVHGGAIPLRPRPTAPRSSDARPYARLGQQVWAHLSPAGTLLIGTGLPGLGLVEAIVADPPESDGLTVVTDSLDAAILLARVPTLAVYNIGGAVSRRTHGQEGDWAITELRRLRVDTAVVCPTGVSVTDGLSVDTPTGAAICRTETGVGRRVIALADAGTIGVTAFVQFATIDEIDELVIAGEVADHDLQPFVDHGTRLSLVPTSSASSQTSEGRPDR